MDVDDDDDIQIIEPGDASFAGWASLVAEQAAQEEDETGDSDDLDVERNLFDLTRDSDSEASSPGSGHTAKPALDRQKFSQMLDLMVQQATTLDRLRAELSQAKEQQRRERVDRDAQLQQSQSQAKRYLLERDQAVSTREKALADMAALKAQKQNGRQTSDPNMLSLDEHRRIVQRVETEAKNRVAIGEAEKSELVLQISKLRIELIQATNETSEDQYPAHVMDALSDRLKKEMEKSCLTIISKKTETSKALSSAEKELAELDTELGRANAALTKEESRATTLAAENDELHEALNRTEDQIANLEEEKERMREDLIDFDENFATMSNELQDSQLQRDELRSQLTDTEFQRDEALSERDRVSKELASVIGHRDALLTELAELETQRDELLTEREERDHFKEMPSDAANEEKLTDAIAELDELKAQLDDVTLERDDLASTSLSMSKRNDELDTKVLSLEQQLNTSTTELATVKAERDSLKAERDSLKSERDLVKAERDLVKTERDSVKTERDSAKAERDAALKDKVVVSKELSTLKSNAKNNGKKSADVMSELNDIKGQLDDATLERDVLASSLTSFQKRTDEAIAKLSSVQKELERATTEFTAVKAERDSLKADRDSLKDSREALRTERDSLEAERDAAVRTRNSVSDELSILKNDVKSNGKKSADVIAELKDVKGQLDEVTLERDVLASTNQSLSRKSNELDSKLSSVQKELQTVTSELQALRKELDAVLVKEGAVSEELALLKKNEKKSAEVTAEFKDAKARLEEVTLERDTLTTANAFMSKWTNELDAKLFSVQKELKTATTESNSLKAERDTELSAAKARWEAKLSVVKAERDAAIKDKSNVSEELSTLKHEQTAVIRQRDQLQKNIRDLEKQLAEVKTAVKQVSEERTEATKQSDKLRASIVEAEKSRDQLQSTLEATVEERNKVSSNRDELRTSLKRAEDECKKVKAQSKRIESKLGELEAEHVEAIREVERWKKLATNHATTCDELNASIEKNKEEHDQLLAKYKSVKDRLNKLKGNEKESNRRLNQLKNYLKDAESRLQEATRKLERTEDDLKEMQRTTAEGSARRAQDIVTDEKEANERNTKLQEETAELRAKLNNTESLVTELIVTTSKDKRSLAKAEARIERLEAARARMAAIYGKSFNATLSPDRANAPLRLGTPASSPPPGLMAQDSSIPRKRPRLSRHSRTASEYTQPDMEIETEVEEIPTPISPFSLSFNGPTEITTHGTPSRHAASAAPLLAVVKSPEKHPWVPSFMQKFSQIATWISEEGKYRCGFCQLENTHANHPPRSDLTFDPDTKPDLFWDHIRTLHAVYLRPELRITGGPPKDPQHIRSESSTSIPSTPTSAAVAATAEGGSATPTAFTTSMTDAERRKRVRDVLNKFAFLSSWESWPAGRFLCGFCQLENFFNDKPAMAPLPFDPERRSDLFWAHCRSSHGTFWAPAHRDSVEMVPHELL